MVDALVTVACAGVSSGCGCESCAAIRSAAAAGARPAGVPIRIYGAYLEARSALRANAPALANTTLEWLLGHLAEERGARPASSLDAKLAALSERGVITPRVRSSLFARALDRESDATGRAWALLSIAEHVFYRLYLSG